MSRPTLPQLHAQYLSASICRSALERAAAELSLPELDVLVEEARAAEVRCRGEYLDACTAALIEVDTLQERIERGEVAPA